MRRQAGHVCYNKDAAIRSRVPGVHSVAVLLFGQLLLNNEHRPCAAAKMVRLLGVLGHLPYFDRLL